MVGVMAASPAGDDLDSIKTRRHYSMDRAACLMGEKPYHRAIAFVILSDRRERRISVSLRTWRFFVAIASQNDKFRRHACPDAIALTLSLAQTRPRFSGGNYVVKG